MYCSKCGKQIDEDSRFCPYCGNTVTSGSTQKAPEERKKVQAGASKPQIPVMLVTGGVVAVLVLVVSCVFLFKSLGNKDAEQTNGLAKESSSGREDVDDKSGNSVQSQSESVEVTPEPTPEPYVQVGTQIDGGEYHGLTWVYTDANELIITGNLDKGYPEEGVHWNGSTLFENGIYLNAVSTPWEKYYKDTEIASLSFSGAETLSFFFFGYENLKSIDLSNLDTRNVTDMSGMFYGCSSLTSIDLSNLDTRNVTSMGSDIDDYYFEIGMFCRCSSLTSIDLSNLDTRNVTSMSGMFSGCRSLTSIDLSNLDTRNVTSMRSMFNECENLLSIDLSNLDTGNVTNMKRMFRYCRGLMSIDLSNLDTGNVTDMENMFYFCDSLTNINLSGIDTGNVTNMHRMFKDCSSLSSIDLSDLDTKNVEDMSYMFKDCYNLGEILVGSGWQTAPETDYMLDGCETNSVTYK